MFKMLYKYKMLVFFVTILWKYLKGSFLTYKFGAYIRIKCQSMNTFEIEYSAFNFISIIHY